MTVDFRAYFATVLRGLARRRRRSRSSAPATRRFRCSRDLRRLPEAVHANADGPRGRPRYADGDVRTPGRPRDRAREARVATPGDLRVRRPVGRARGRAPARRAQAGRRRVPGVPRRPRPTSPTRTRCSPASPTPTCASSSAPSSRRRRRAAPSSRRRLKELLDPARPQRRQERDRRDPRRRGRRGGEPLGRRPLPHVRGLREAPRLEARGAVEPAVGHGRLPRAHARRQGRGRLGAPQVRGRAAPRAARPRHREPGTRPHERGDGGGAPRSRRGRRRRSIRTTSRSTCTGRAGRAVRA